ncbi:acyl-phosphate glycerol 3-phosphate acyltransferase [Solimonas sp. K1W22B-7]|uniref:1-acyl-sn-glycerol-3-phosphate acyltransferase n=1 Tax=Solimonas sp. K1W22B-7 TaxID=2303331 RepID=UPI000E336611|nr:1-acyl-sn-glycerol-3-phosphate acyltransferase [Solimonas sp. K1W22B-7]AXQ28651.1 acyl-phosphate glycerol 3-phosphate acyltransferase [Solimonas sp. K1W22B-7]
MMAPLGPRVPQRGNAFSRGLGRLVLRLMGWRVDGGVPDAPKMVLIGAPHTTNMDGVIAFAILISLGIRASTMIKDSAFRGFGGVVLRWLGAVPVNRKSPKGVVEQSVDAFNDNPQFVLLLAPEGTRSAPKAWKRGFHHVAYGAGVPIVAAAIDYQRKLVTFGPPLQPTSDYEADVGKLQDYVAAHSSPRHAERLSKPIADRQGRPWSGGGGSSSED